LDVLFVIGLAIVLSYMGALILKRMGIPQTLGFMIVGIVLGIVGIANDEMIQSLRMIVSLALGLIGYNIGHELRSKTLGSRFKKLIVIVIIEATAAFWLVSLLLFIITGQWHIAILFGAVASATAPAATADVVWESEFEGPLTSSLMFVLAADDIVAVILTNSAIAYATFFYGATTLTMLEVIVLPILKIFGAAAIGAIFGFIYLYPVNREEDRGRLLELELGMVILLIGLMGILQMSDIFAAMVFGFVVGKKIDEDKEEVPVLLQRIMSPIIMIFFVLVGARMASFLTLESTLLTIIGTAAVYLIGRTVAKYFGAAVGATIVGEDVTMRKYLGSCLFCQAGVALGLSFIIEETFLTLGGDAATWGTLILGVVALSTMVLEAVGPLSVKYSLEKAGELPEDHEIFEPHTITKFDGIIEDDRGSCRHE